MGPREETVLDEWTTLRSTTLCFVKVVYDENLRLYLTDLSALYVHYLQQEGVSTSSDNEYFDLINVLWTGISSSKEFKIITQSTRLFLDVSQRRIVFERVSDDERFDVLGRRSAANLYLSSEFKARIDVVLRQKDLFIKDCIERLEDCGVVLSPSRMRIAQLGLEASTIFGSCDEAIATRSIDVEEVKRKIAQSLRAAERAILQVSHSQLNTRLPKRPSNELGDELDTRDGNKDRSIFSLLQGLYSRRRRRTDRDNQITFGEHTEKNEEGEYRESGNTGEHTRVKDMGDRGVVRSVVRGNKIRKRDAISTSSSSETYEDIDQSSETDQDDISTNTATLRARDKRSIISPVETKPHPVRTPVKSKIGSKSAHQQPGQKTVGKERSERAEPGMTQSEQISMNTEDPMQTKLVKTTPSKQRASTPVKSRIGKTLKPMDKDRMSVTQCSSEIEYSPSPTPRQRRKF